VRGAVRKLKARKEGELPRARLIDVAADPQLRALEVGPANPGLLEKGDIVVADVGNRTLVHRISRGGVLA